LKNAIPFLPFHGVNGCDIVNHLILNSNSSKMGVGYCYDALSKLVLQSLNGHFCTCISIPSYNSACGSRKIREFALRKDGLFREGLLYQVSKTAREHKCPTMQQTIGHTMHISATIDRVHIKEKGVAMEQNDISI
jgi:hypothetical protein